MLFFLVNLAYASDSARIIIQKDDTKSDDFVINLYNGDYLDNQPILDYSTKKNELGYLIRSNIDIIIHIANRDIISKACSVEFFYYDILNNRNLKIRTKDTYYLFDSAIRVIPDHTYNYLNNLNRLYGKTFVVKINYEKKVDNNIDTSTDSDINIVDNDDYQIQHCSKSYYFKLLSEDEYTAYKKIKDDADNFSIKKKSSVNIK